MRRRSVGVDEKVVPNEPGGAAQFARYPAAVEPAPTDHRSRPDLSCRRTRTAQGALVALGPAVLVWSGLAVPSTTTQHLTFTAQLVGALWLLAAGTTLPWAGRLPRVAATLGSLCWTAGFLLDHLTQPGVGFAVLLGLTWILVTLWPAEVLRRRDVGVVVPVGFPEVQAAATVAVLASVSTWFSTATAAAALVPLAMTVLLTASLAWRSGVIRAVDGRRRFLLVATLALSVGTPLVVAVGAAVLPSPDAWAGVLPLSVVGPAVVLVAVRRWLLVAHTGNAELSLLDLVLLHPPRVLVLSFGAISLLGAFALALPAASPGPGGIGALPALFTAVSATCVTGLVVLDTAVDFSLFGQVVVLALIQVGGLGIMVFSAAVVVVLGRRMSVRHEAVAVDLVGASGRAGLSLAVKRIITVSLLTELVSAALLLPAFVADGDDVFTAAWRALFTAVSAFCNAGFALQSDSLIPYATNPYILGVIAATFILGGLGPAVVASLNLRGRRLGLQAHLVVTTSVLLTVIPGLLLLFFEWEATLAGLPLVDKVTNAFFQAATLRTAGFNSVDLAHITPAAWTVMLAVMFVGGSPGSTAGGVKTTTLAIIALAVAAVVRGRDRVEAAGRTIPAASVLRATAVMTVGVVSCAVAAIALQLTQTMDAPVLLFEVVSALATVGLSMGGTSQLDEVGQVIVIVAMFAGRIGPLTFFVFLASRARSSVGVRLPEEQVAVG